MFDAISPAIVASTMTVSQLLDPARAARVVEQHALDDTQLGLEEVLEALVAATFGDTTVDGYEAEIVRAVQRVVADRMMWLVDQATLPQVRVVTVFRLCDLARALTQPGDTTADQAHRQLLVSDIQRFLDRPGPAVANVQIPQAPPGSPIGDPAIDWIRDFERWCDWVAWGTPSSPW